MGEILGILGLNGCGKTTLLRNLSPGSGCILLDGSDIADMSKKDIAKRVAVVPQTNKVSSFTVRDVVSMSRMPFQGMMSGCSKDDEEIIDRALEQTGLTKYTDNDISNMSGGERQRVIITKAIAQTRDVLLMDEPTPHLDINIDGSASVVNGLKAELGETGYPRDFRYQSREQVEFLVVELQRSRTPFFLRAYQATLQM